MPPDVAPPARGITAQPSMSARLMRAETIPAGSEIWVEDDEQVWVLAEVLRQENTILTVRRKSSGKIVEIDLGFGETYPQNPKVVSDMTALHHIHEAGILYNLGERSKVKKQRPYTFMGTILIAVNPLRKVPDPDMDEYTDRGLNPDAPHPYAIAELAYHQMRLGAGRQSTNQSIVVSGESGAGKTETSKIILRFLTHRSVGGISGLEQKVVDSSPILESFGNAKTLRNNNSSRFGKFLKLQFTRDKYRLAGAFIETYLLEKSRVLAQGENERNFHILYELVAGCAGAGLATKLKLESKQDYPILARSGCVELDGVDDAAQFKGVQKAFDTIGMEADVQVQVWQVLAAILHMSKVQFDVVESEQGEIASVGDREALNTLGTLLGVEEEKLEAMLTQSVVVTRGEQFTKQLGVQDAALTRDAIVKTLYEAMFLWIVQVINASLGKGEESLPFIGVLDIFGFENFDTKNEFEQLLINFTNESLQDTFNKQVFNNELKLYEEEGIDVVVSTCPDNAECLKMLSTKPKGIIPRLDNVCAEPNSSDSRYLESLHKEYVRHQDFPRTKPQEMRECFWVKHYAGKVKYTVHGWVERNMDRIPKSFNDTLQSSSLQVVKDSTARYNQAPPGTASGRAAAPRQKTLVKPTVAKAFLASMQDLNVTLLSTTCNFVRCIKPNAGMTCGVYDNRYVVEQLQCLGILQTCEVLKVGMPTRVTYTELKEVLGDNANEAEKLFEGEPETALIAAILWAFEVPSEAFRLGRTRVFFRAGQISTLQKILNETSPEKGPWIFSRLQEALANRHKAKAAAEEARDAVAAAEQAVNEAQDEATKILGEEEDDGDGSNHRPPPPSVVSEEELYDLEVIAKKARTAGSTVPQVTALVEAAEEDQIGKFAKGAMERVKDGSKAALEDITEADSKASELESEITTARGGDREAEMQRLEMAVNRLKDASTEAQKLSVGAQEAAAKCQVDKTHNLMEEAKKKAKALTAQASAVTNGAKDMAQATVRQQEALIRAKNLAGDAASAADKAQSAFSSFKVLIEEANADEDKARAAEEARLKRDADEARKAKAAKEEAEAKEKARLAEEEASNARKAENLANLKPSPAPFNRKDTLSKNRGRSQSVRKLLESDVVRTPDTSVSPQRKREESFDSVKSQGPNKKPGLNTRNFEDVFKEALEGGCVEGHLMKQSKFFSRWKPRYFRLEDGFLTYYDKKSLVGTHKNKGMELTAHSITSYTNTKNCFCVRTAETVWFLLAKDEDSMNKWMTAINAQIHSLFIKQYDVPADNYASKGLKGRFFYRMVDDALPQWIRTYPEEAAPRTGDGLFPGEVIEVLQVMQHRGIEFLRIDNQRGWTYAKNPGDNAILFEEISGEVAEDHRSYGFPSTARDPVPILFGPGLESQQTGEALVPGERAEAKERFTPADGSGVVFIKLADGRGWVPVRKKNGSFGVSAAAS